MKNPKVGDHIDDRYELRRQLGENETCVLFEAVHRYTNRRVVMKLLRCSDSPGESETLLLRDAFALGRIRHPYLVEVLDAGVSHSVPYVVTALLEGRSLDGLLAARGVLTPDETATVGRQIALALEALHRNGLLHGDVSPGNVWIVRSPLGDEQVVLRNLQMTYEPRKPVQLEGPRRRSGSFAYRSPESQSGRAIDPRSDLYSLGVLMFECLLGRPPAGLASERSDGEVPSLRVLRPELPGALTFAVERCLRTATAERFSCARDLVGSLEATHIAHATTRFLSGSSQHGLRAITPLLDPPLRRYAFRRPTPSHGSPSAAPAIAPEQPTGVSRRRIARAAYTTPVRLVGHHGVMEGRVEDISTRGVLVIAAHTLEIGAVVQMTFALPGSGVMVQTSAVLRWVRIAPSSQRAALGFEFQVPPIALRNAVESYVIERESVSAMDEGPPKR
jgi:hypothetical protein